MRHIPSFTRLAYLIRETRYCLFLGAGASVESGGYTAPDIAWGILRRLYGTKANEELSKLFETEYGKPSNFENVLEALGTSSAQRRDMIRDFFDTMIPSEGYQYLAALLKAGYFHQVVLTTNSDHMLEDALYADTIIDKPLIVRTIIGEELSSSRIKPKKDEIIIVKLNGDISKPDSLRITATETISLSETCERLIAHALEQQGLIVIGYRARDIGVRNALERSKPSQKGLYWVTKSALDEIEDREILLMLDRHNSRANIIGDSTFDIFLTEMGVDLARITARRKQQNELDEAWILLDRARSFGGERQNILQQLDDLSSRMLGEIDLEEVLALHEFVRYELNRSGETYRLQQGVHFLERAIEGYAKYANKDELNVIEHALLAELLNLFLTGNQVPGGRLGYLDRLITRVEALLAKIQPRDSMARARALIVLTEALKEKAMITMECADQIGTYTKARSYGEEAISLLKDIDMSESKYLLGAAYRHTAVAYELEGDIATNEEKRRESYEKWRQYSSTAVDMLNEVGEDTICGYALMNLASSYLRLCVFEVSDSKKHQLLETGKGHLQESIKCVQGVEDHRGIGWAYMHLCENTRQRLDLSRDENEKSVLLFELESSANSAIAELRQVEDHLAQGLAYKQLGIALYLAFENNREGIKIKLERAAAVLQQSVERLKATGYYRGAAEAFYWLGKCQFALWEQTSEVDYLAWAIQSLLQGIVSTATRLEEKAGLDQLYGLLNTQLRRLL